MGLLELADERAITTNLQSLDKEGVIEELVELLVKADKVTDKKLAIDDIFKREAKGSTGIGKGVAIPHAKTESVKKLCMAIGISKDGVDFDAIDGKYAYMFFLLLSPPGSAGPHVEALAYVSKFVSPPGVRDKLKNAKTPDDIIQIISDFENNV